MQTVRLFLSSTFIDFKAERNALRGLLNSLGAAWRERGVRLQVIDLSWGIDDEAERKNLTMAICLEEVRRCRAMSQGPRMLIMLGERYGWCPPPSELDCHLWNEVVERLPERYRRRLDRLYRMDKNAGVRVLEPGRPLGALAAARLHAILSGIATEGSRLGAVLASATEQEIAEGLLAGPDDDGGVFCLLRRIRDLPSDERASGWRDLDCGDPPHPGRTLQERLAQLKGRVMARLPSNQTSSYETVWRDATTGLPGSVQDVVLRWIECSTAAAADRAPLARNAFDPGEDARVFVGRTAELQRIHDHLTASADGAPAVLMVHGPSGIGKSALMRQALAQAGERHPDALVVGRFVGATPGSVVLRSLLQDVTADLRASAALPASEHVHTLAESVNELTRTLAAVATSRRVMILLDALDQLSPGDDVDGFAWLPTLPPNVRLVLSSATESDDEQQTLRQQLPVAAFMNIDRLSADDTQAVLDEWLAQDRRALESAQRDSVLRAAGQTGSPLHLRMLYEASRGWRSYDTPSPPLGQSVPGAVQQMLANLVYRRQHGKGLVGRVIALLGAARHGLTEDELMEVIWEPEYQQEFRAQYKDSPETQRLPFVVWSRLRFDLAPYLVERDADGAVTLALCHRAVAAAATTSPGVRPKGETHRRLAEYFANQSTVWREGAAVTHNARKLSELPYQQLQAGMGAQLLDTLGDFEFLDASVRARGVHVLLDDLRMVADGVRARHLWIDEEVRALDLLRHSLELSAQALVVDDTQLASQLSGRLKGRKEPLLARLLAGALLSPQDWLLPTSTALFAVGAPLIRSIGLHKHCVTALAVVGDGERLLTGSSMVTRTGDFPLKLWRAVSGVEVRQFRGKLGDVTSLAVSPTGDLFASGSSDGAVRLWSMAEDTPTHEVCGAHGAQVSSLVFSPDGAHLFSGSHDGTVRIWTRRGQRTGELCGHGQGVNALVLSGDLLLSGSHDRSVAVWDVQAARRGLVKEPLRYLGGPHAHSGSVDALAVAAGGAFALVGSNDGRVRMWRMDGSPVAAWDMADGCAITAMTTAAIDDREFLLCGDARGRLWIWDLRDMTRRGFVQAHTFEISGMRHIGASNVLVTTSKDTSVKLWRACDLVRWSPGGELHGPPVYPAPPFAELPARSWRATLACGEGATWSSGPDSVALTASDGKLIRQWRVTGQRASAVVSTPDGRWLYTSAATRAEAAPGPFGITKWDLDTAGEANGPVGRTLPSAHDREVNALAISGDGKRLLSVGDDWTGVLWDTGADTPIARFTAEGPLVACWLDRTGDLGRIADEAGRVHVLQLVRGPQPPHSPPDVSRTSP